MRLLLDTHVLLWAVSAPERIARAPRAAIEDPSNSVFVSVASMWEVAVKFALGKLPLTDSPEITIANALVALAADELVIRREHALRAGALPHHHRDPFDRMLVAQALCEGATLVSVDPLLAPHGLAILWAGPAG